MATKLEPYATNKTIDPIAKERFQGTNLRVVSDGHHYRHYTADPALGTGMVELVAASNAKAGDVVFISTNGQNRDCTVENLSCIWYENGGSEGARSAYQVQADGIACMISVAPREFFYTTFFGWYSGRDWERTLDMYQRGLLPRPSFSGSTKVK